MQESKAVSGEQQVVDPISDRVYRYGLKHPFIFFMAFFFLSLTIWAIGRSWIHLLAKPQSGGIDEAIWEWLKVLIVPFALVIAAWLLDYRVREREHQAKSKRDEQRDNEEKEHNLQDTLDRYIDFMANLSTSTTLTANHLQAMQVRTVTALEVLNKDNPKRNKLLKYLRRTTLLTSDGLFRGADLVNLNFANTSLDSTIFQACDLTGSLFTNADLGKADFDGATIDDVDLCHAKMDGVRGKIASAVNATLKGASIKNAQLEGANLAGADFTAADMTDALLSGAKLSKSNFANTILIGAHLDDADLHEVDLRGSDLTGAILDRANLQDAIFDDKPKINQKWQIVWAIVNQKPIPKGKEQNELEEELAGGSLTEEESVSWTTPNSNGWRGPDLSGADLEDSFMAGIDLSQVRLRSARLARADLTGCRFNKADLSNADLRGATLDETDFSEADLTGAVVSRSSWDNVMNCAGAELPMIVDQ